MWRDVDQDYLIAWAALNGQDPYLPVPELARRFGENHSYHVLQHASPHPPTAILWLLPLVTLSMQMANKLWFVLSLVSAYASSVLMVSLFRPDWRSRYLSAAVVCSVPMVLAPSREDLYWGQYGFFHLLIFLLAWRSYRDRSHVICGMYLGIALTLKLMVWPLLLYLLLSRHLKVVAGVALSYLPVMGVVTWQLGYATWERYFKIAIPGVLRYWQGFCFNLSVAGFFQGFFTGNFVERIVIFIMPRVVLVSDEFDAIVSIIDRGMWCAFILALLYTALRKDANPHVSFWRMIIGLTIISPISWLHYMIVIYPALFTLAANIYRDPRFFKSRLTQLLVIFPVVFPKTLMYAGHLVYILAEYGYVTWLDQEVYQFPWPVVLILKLPTVAIAYFALTYNPGPIAAFEISSNERTLTEKSVQQCDGHALM